MSIDEKLKRLSERRSKILKGGGVVYSPAIKGIGADLVFALPTAEIAVMGPEGAANIIFKKEIETSEAPETTRKQKIEEY